MADEKRVVQTDFIANTAKFSGPAQAMAQQASSLGSVLTATTGLVGVLGSAVAGLGVGAALKGIASLHSEFESTKLALGGMFAALGVSDNFAEGMKDAAEAQKAITIAAAKLPGEAEDYIAVFRAGLPQVRSAIGGTLKDTYTFTNQLTAVTSTLQIASEQVARDIPRLLAATKGQAGGQNITWTRLLPFLQKLPEQADLTAQKFNNMSQTARGALLKQLVFGEQLGQMVTAAGDTWDAQTGALASNARMLIREGSGPLFEGMKQGLAWVNNLLFDAEGSMTGFSKTITNIGKLASTHLVDKFKRAFEWSQKIGGGLLGIAEKISKSPGFTRLYRAAETLKTTAGDVASGEGVGAGGLAHLGPMIGGLIDAFSRPGVLESVVSPLGTVFNQLTQLIAPFMAMMGPAQAIVGDMFATILPAFSNALVQVVGPLVSFLSGVFDVASFILTSLRPTLQVLWDSISKVVSAVGIYLHNYLRLLGGSILWVFNKVKGPLTASVNFMIKALTSLFNLISTITGKMGGNLGKLADELFGPEAKDDESNDLLGGIMKSLSDMNKKDDTAANAAKAAQRGAPEVRGGGKTVQDFRNSRFDITQKFAEGYDPDRIAVMFARDVAQIGEARLGSGHEPTH